MKKKYNISFFQIVSWFVMYFPLLSKTAKYFLKIRKEFGFKEKET